MTPELSPVTAPIVLRVPTRPDERRRRERDAGEAFRRALQERGAEPGADEPKAEEPAQPGAAPATPTPRGLQQRAPAGRREQGAAARHVDVIA